MSAILKRILDGISGNVDVFFESTFKFVGVVFTEGYALTEWAFKVGTRLMLLYLTYQLVFEDLMDKILEAL